MHKAHKAKRFLAAVVALAISIPTAGLLAPTVEAGTVGNGFTVTAGDLSFILKQIKIAERHADQLVNHSADNPSPTTDPNFCSALVGPNQNQIPDRLTPYGLRTVDGACNNLFPDRDTFAASDQPFPRLTTPVFRDAEPITPDFPVGPPGPTSYDQKLANNVVIDSQPRVISNLIVDQTSTNPAAVAAAEFPVRTQGNPGLFPCTIDPSAADPDGTPNDCVPAHKTLFIPNVTTDVGLSPPYNSLFTFFGQFFDHGVDQTVKSGGTVFVPLKADDPLITVGPDGKPNTGDEVPPEQAFMVLTRAQNQPGPDGHLGTADDIQDANNTDSPWVDQSQTYTSHSSHQVFLREYSLVAGHPVSTGRLLGGIANDQNCSTTPAPCYNDGNATTTSISTWASTKQQAAQKLGLLLKDADVTNIPMIAADPYGNFIPDATTGLPDYVTATGLVSGNLANPVPVPANVLHFDTPFLTDIAHNADPSPQDTNGDGQPDTIPTPDADFTASADFAAQPPLTYDDEMLNDHFTCGDGRCNENIALSTIHQIFHSEHDRLANEFDQKTLPADTTLQNDYQATNCAIGCATNNPALPTTFTYGQRLFQAARFVTEMEYQHLVFEEFARKIQPAVRPFHVYNPDANPAIPAEFAHAVYRFGHSMLDDDVARTNVDATGHKTDNSLPLLTAFLNPPEYFDGGTGVGTLSPEKAAGSIVMGSSDQVGNELDEFVTETLRNNLLGLPLDLPTINMTRARDAGIPPLNDVRRQIFAQNNDGQLAPYTSWSDFGQHLKHPESLINFVAAYGTHPTIVAQTTAAGKRAAARAIVNPLPTDVPPADAAAFMFSTNYPGAAGVNALQAVQPFVWSGAPADFTLSVGTSTTAPISVNDPIATIDAALDAIVTGGVTVTGGPNAGDDFTVTFNVAGPAAGIVASDANLAVSNPTTGVTGSAAIPAKDWSNDPNGVTQTGLDSVDLWVGGLAEVTNLFGGLLGSTFNYVFQNSLENLQDFDRLYYLNRTQGMNLRTQLEGNSFSEMIQRNTDGTSTLKADAFATADCKFELANLNGTPAGFTAFGKTVADDPSTTDCDESLLLEREPDGRILYKAINTVDPSGINGQAVYNGTDNADRVKGGNDNDTFWGGKGNDVIEGNGGDDVALGGEGNDIITDLAGADVPKGGPGNDAIDGGIGDDIPMGGDGQDFINGGANDNETFAGPGDDFVIAGQGADAVFGDGGDDWIEGGSGQDLLQGDHGAPFFDDPAETAPGNDVFVGQVGENDYDTEGGDDIMAQNAGVDRNAGAGGFDWAIHQYDTVGADDDLKINQQLVGLPLPVVVNRDRWQETEADSGSDKNDVIHGDDIERVTGPGGFTGCDALDNAGVNRISGLRNLVNTFPTSLADVVAASAAGRCPLVGSAPNNAAGDGVWAEGNILLGGGGSDVIEGRGNDDIIDGDHSVSVAISVRAGVDDNGLPTGAEIGKTDLMEHPYQTGNTHTLQQDVFAGVINPGQLHTVREIAGMGATANTGTAGTCTFSPNQTTGTTIAAGLTNCDTALYTGEIVDPDNIGASYSVVRNSDGSLTVSDLASVAAGPPFPKGDGAADTLWNIENLRFCTAIDANKNCSAFVNVPAPFAPGVVTGVSAVAGVNSATVSFTAPADGGAPITLFNVQTLVGGVATGAPTPGTSSPITVSPLPAGQAVTFVVTATNSAGTSAASAPSNAVTPTAPAAPIAVLAPAAGLAFGNTTVGATSAAQVATLSNTGNAALNISSRVLGGTNPGDFVLGTSTCGATLAAAANCTTSITFRPTAAGNRSATFVVTDNATGSPRTITLTGTGVAPADTAAPTVTARVPAANAVNVNAVNDLSATFSEAVNGVSGTTFQLRQGTATTGASLAGVITQAGNVFTLNPSANLLSGTQYTVTLTGGAAAIRDLAGNPLVTTSWSFTTADTVAPTLTARAPAVGETGVALGTNVTATFSEAMNATTVTAAGNATVRVGTAANGTLVGAVVSFNAASRVLTINPNANLQADTRYTVRLSNGIRDVAGNALVAVTWSFLTGPVPTVAALAPVNNATGIAVASNVTGMFSEPMVAGTVNGTNVTLRQGTAAGGTLIGSVVSYNAATRVVTLNPNTNLAADTRYTLRITGATDTAGNPVVATSWTFLTGPAPTVTARTPGVNAAGVGRNANITATFSEAMAAGTVNATTATLRLGTTATGTQVTSAVTFNAATRVVTINPGVTLTANTQYTVRLSTGITDAAGNALGATTWSFTTGAGL